MQMLQLPHCRQTQTNKQPENLSESLAGEEIVIDLVQTGKFFPGQSNPMCILKNKNKHSSNWHFCDERNYSWPCWSSRNARRFEAQLEMQSRLKLREMQQQGSHAHHQIATKSNIMYQHLLDVFWLKFSVYTWSLMESSGSSSSCSMEEASTKLMNGRLFASPAASDDAAVLTIFLLNGTNANMQSSRLTSEEGRQPLSLSFSTLSNLLLHHAQLRVLLSKEQEQGRRRRHCVHRDEQLRTHLQLLTWQRIALLLVLLLSWMMKKTTNLFFLPSCKTELVYYFLSYLALNQ